MQSAETVSFECPLIFLPASFPISFLLHSWSFQVSIPDAAGEKWVPLASSCIAGEAGPSLTVLPFPHGSDSWLVSLALSCVTLGEGWCWQSSYASCPLQCIQAACFLLHQSAITSPLATWTSAKSFHPWVSAQVCSLGDPRPQLRGAGAGSQAPASFTAYTKVCLPVTQSTVGKDSSWVLWCMVMDPITPTVALLFMDRCWIFVVYLGGKGGKNERRFMPLWCWCQSRHFLCRQSCHLWMKILSFISNLYAFYFSCLIALAMMSNLRLKRSEKVGILAFFFTLGGKLYSLSSLSMGLAIVFVLLVCRCRLLVWGCSLLFLAGYELLSWTDVELWERLFLYLLRWSYCFSLLVCQYDQLQLLLFHYWTPLALLGWPPLDRDVLSFLYFVGFELPLLCWRILHLYSGGIFICSSFLVISLPGSGIRILLMSKDSFSTLWKSLDKIGIISSLNAQ